MSSPHPQLNLTSGRALSRSAGGVNAAQDHFVEQRWKTYPGAGNTVLWCIRNAKVKSIWHRQFESLTRFKFKSDDFSILWPLIVPPMMTFLDDYQARYKLKGVDMASKLVKRAPIDLVKRTGLAQLLQNVRILSILRMM